MPYHQQDNATGFEAAIDILIQLVGHATTKIDHERAREAPEPGLIAQWTHRRDTWAARRRDLDPHDVDATREVLARNGDELRRIQLGLGDS